MFTPHPCHKAVQPVLCTQSLVHHWCTSQLQSHLGISGDDRTPTFTGNLTCTEWRRMVRGQSPVVLLCWWPPGQTHNHSVSHSVMALMSSPCGLQSVSQFGPSKYPCRVSSASCDNFLSFRVFFITRCLWTLGLSVEERKTRLWFSLLKARHAEEMYAVRFMFYDCIVQIQDFIFSGGKVGKC